MLMILIDNSRFKLRFPKAGVAPLPEDNAPSILTHFPRATAAISPNTTG
jgi:hypothetical protein